MLIIQMEILYNLHHCFNEYVVNDINKMVRLMNRGNRPKICQHELQEAWQLINRKNLEFMNIELSGHRYDEMNAEIVINFLIMYVSIHNHNLNKEIKIPIHSTIPQRLVFTINTIKISVELPEHIIRKIHNILNSICPECKKGFTNKFNEYKHQKQKIHLRNCKRLQR